MTRRSLQSALAIGLLTMTVFWAPSGAATNAADYVVGFFSLPGDLSHYDNDSVVQVSPPLSFLVVRSTDPDRLERRLSMDPRVAYFERDRAIYHLDAAPGDPRYSSAQYDLQPSTTNLEIAWSKTHGSTAVKVCIVDTGQYRNHEDLRGVHWTDWKDFVHNRSAAYDDNGHGTHVTATIAAVTDNGKGIAGVAQVSVAGAKVLDGSGSGYISWVSAGIAWCADVGAHVISLSLGGASSGALSSAVRYASNKGSLLVAAAGNDGPCTRCVGYPAAYPPAFAVACTDASNRLCSFSSQGPEVDIAAPGKDILSAYPTGLGPCAKRSARCYVSLSGTSMSTPHVAGLAALVKSAHAGWSAGEIRDRIQATAVDLGARGADPKFGAGLMRGEAV
jgi:subtilisin family serine protease